MEHTAPNNVEENISAIESTKFEEVIEPIIGNAALPDEQKVKQIVGIMQVQESFSGPIPHPIILKGYKELVPDAPERIMQMAEQEQQHRHLVEIEMLKQNKQNIEISADANKRSQIFAFVLVIFLISVGTIFAFMELVAVSVTIFGSTLVAVAAVFIAGKHKNKE